MIKLGKHKWIKRIVVTTVIVGLILFVGTIALLGYAFNKVSNMASAARDTDLVAIEHLVTEKSIVLAEEQKAKLAPLVKELTKPGLLPEQEKTLKEQMLGILDPAQQKTMKDWTANTQKEANSLVESTKAPLIGVISKYTGIPTEQLQQPLKSLSAWWQLKTPENSGTDSLLKQLEGN